MRNIDYLKQQVADARRCINYIAELRREIFPIGSVVVVNCDRFNGQAIVANYDCQPDQLACRLENGNTWWYPLDQIRPINEGENLDRWIEREKKIQSGKGYIEQRCRCGKTFKAHVKKVALGNGKHCSILCSNRFQKRGFALEKEYQP